MKAAILGKATTDSVAATEVNPLFPVFLKLDQLQLLIVGGGNIGYEKLQTILNNAPEANVRLIALEISDAVIALAAYYPNVKLVQKAFESSDLDGVDLVISAVNDAVVSEHVYRSAKERAILINAADQPRYCDFYLGSIVTKGHLKIAVSTNGKSPVLAKRIKEYLNEAITDDIHGLIDSMSELRSRLSGDFNEKVRRLNELTQSLAYSEIAQKNGERRWRKIASWSLFAFFFMFLGHLILSYVSLETLVTSGRHFIIQMDPKFYIMILAGFFAQLVDGALGMGYGVTCTTVLLSAGVPLPAISGSIHTAEMFSSGASGFSHYKFGNVNKKLFKYLVAPGVIGAILGAWLLAKYGNDYANYFRPVLAVYTLLLGARIIWNAFRKNKKVEKLKRVGWLAAAGGFLDSFGGGGWGPLVTSTLISKGKTPKYVIGTVSITEFFVTLASALTFFSLIGISHWMVIAGLIIGGLIAAPIAARLAGKLPLKTMFIGVGALVIIWSLNVIIRAIL
ncbi:TSUP family transporter [Taibaiella soli]|uniref:Probable membrane transporter protein n=1 Tax=Taibaiella soli TaxID=1649169 RepID=A0A2W2BV27_9BACT|nr:TSUP family transporter [Taibaiella soli]PZF71663.1 ABC transporter permease [Taibaiella soli]